MKRLAHVESHLRPKDRAFLPWLLMPLSHEEIAVKMGPGWTRRQVETAWLWVKVTMGLEEGVGRMSLNRLELLRMVMGLDPCVCERYAADLREAS